MRVLLFLWILLMESTEYHFWNIVLLQLLPSGIVPRRERVDLSMIRVTWSSPRNCSAS